MQDQRDPVSKWFDAAALRFLARAYETQGDWAGIYLAPPTRAQLARLRSMGINPLERDRWGEYRWVRAFKRSVYFNLKHHGFAGSLDPSRERLSDWPAKSLEWQTGQRVLRAGWPSRRWAIRMRLHTTGRAATVAAAAKVPARKRWVTPGGKATDRASTIADRDWIGY